MDITRFKLGKKPAKIDPRTFKLADLVTLAPPPQECDWLKGVEDWGQMLNNDLGDCTCAAIGHAEQIVTLNTPVGEITVPDQVVLDLYEQSCGYVPGDPSTDNGGVIVDVLNWVRHNGFGNRHQSAPHHRKHPLYAYADPNPNDLNHVLQAISVFGVVDIGLQLPLTAQAQTGPGKVWDVVGDGRSGGSAPGSWGGHSVVVAKYSQPDKTISCVTWGAVQAMTFNFFRTYVDETHALLFKLWVEHSGLASNVNLTMLDQILRQVTN